MSSPPRYTFTNDASSPPAEAVRRVAESARRDRRSRRRRSPLVPPARGAHRPPPGAWGNAHGRHQRPPPGAAELDVVDVLGDRRVVAADGAVGIAPHRHLVERRTERVEEEQPPGERVAAVEDQLQRLARLQRADDAGQDAEDASSAQLGAQLGAGEEAAVAGPGPGANTVTCPSKRKIEPCTTGIPCQIDASFTRWRVGKLSAPSTITSHPSPRIRSILGGQRSSNGGRARPG